MINSLTKLSQHLACVALSRLPFANAVALQEEALARFGPVSSQKLASWNEALAFLQPLRSFPRRYVVAECGMWCLVLSDMIGEWCRPDVLFHSRATRCVAVAGIAVGIERRFSFIEKGAVIRDLHTFYEDRWENRSEGVPMPFEKHRAPNRLSEPEVADYLTHVCGVPFPLSREFTPGRILGFERSWAELRIQPKDFWVLNDLCEANGPTSR